MSSINGIDKENDNINIENIMNEWKELLNNNDNINDYNNELFSCLLDSKDELCTFRNKFNIPTKYNIHHKNTLHIQQDQHKHIDNKECDDLCLYFCGNSLGLQPKLAHNYVLEEMNKWNLLGVEGHFYGTRPWAIIDSKVTQLSEHIVGAKYNCNEIAICNSLSVNLHLLLISFYRPTQSRYKLLIEESAFCSDHHIVRSQLQMHGLSIDKALIQLKPKDGEYTLSTQQIINTIKEHGDTIACILLPGVQFYTGQYFDIKSITSAGHSVGANVGFDLAHAVGNIPLKLHEWNVDFAAWCSYKYLNSGPGSIGGLFVHYNHHSNIDKLTRLSGWWGQHPEIRFKMLSEHTPAPGAQAYLMSNPAVLPTVCLQASLEIFIEADINKLRQKSIRLTAYLYYCISKIMDEFNNPELCFSIITPNNINERGCQLSLLFNCNARPILELLELQGCVTDYRAPNVIRISPTPLYNKYIECYKFAQILKQILHDYKPPKQ